MDEPRPKRPTGRRKLSEARRRDKAIKVYVTQPDLDMIQAAADAVGLSVSDYARMAIMTTLKRGQLDLEL